MIKKLIGSWVVQLFCVLWAIFLFLDYFNYSDYFVNAFKYVAYTDFIITYFILAIGAAALFSNRKSPGVVLEIRNFRGIYHYLFVILAMGLLMAFYLFKTKITPQPIPGTFVFIIKTFVFHLGFGLIVLAAMSTGSYLLAKLAFRLDLASSALISIALGFFVITMGLFLFGAMGLLHQFIVIPFILLLLLPGWKNSISIIKQVLFKKSDSFQIHILALLAYAFLILLIAINLDFTSRPYPIGFDSLNLYMNTPKLIAGYHGLTQGGDAYNWSLIMSLGFIMYNSSLISILLSVAPGILSVIVIYKICLQLQINRNWSLFACALFYSLPNTIWQSKNDAKIDLALLFISLCAILLFIVFQTTGANDNTKKEITKPPRFPAEMTVWVLCGILIGFAFGIKYVSMLSIFAFLVVIFYTNAGKYGAIAIFFLNIALILGLDLTRFAAFERDLMLFRFIGPFVFGLTALFFAFRKNRLGMVLAAKKSFLFCATIGITFLPWVIKNVSEHENISFNNMLTGKLPLPELYPAVSNPSGNLIAPEEHSSVLTHNENITTTHLAGFSLIASNDQSQQRQEKRARRGDRRKFNEADTTGANNPYSPEKVEEIRRYLGFEPGIIRFISLPYDIVMKTNVHLGSADSGILVLILLPVFIFVFRMRQLHWNIIKMLALLFFLIVSILSVHLFTGPIDFDAAFEALRTKVFPESEFLKSFLLPVYIALKQPLLMLGKVLMPIYYYLTTQTLGVCFILIVLLTFPLYFFFKSSIDGLSFISKSLVALVYCIIQYWLFLSSGIIWYGIVGFSLLPVIFALLATNINNNSYNENKFIHRYVSICTTVWFVLMLPFQFMPVIFLSQPDRSQIKFKEFMDVPFVKYAIGEQNERAVFKQFFNHADQNIIKTLNSDKKARVLNISTFLNYHIIDNDIRVYKDNQMGIFKEIASHANNDRLLIPAELRKKQIKYVLVGLNTARIDMTPDKSITKKFNNLMKTMVNNPEVRLLYTNRLVKRPDGDIRIIINGETVLCKYDAVGEKVIERGTVALFEIL